MNEIIKSVNLDADEQVFFGEQLQSVKARTYDVKYPVYKAKQLIPVSADAGSGAETIAYEQFDSVGSMKLIQSYADDLPRSDVKGAKFYSPVESIGGSYGYSIQEIRAAQMAGKPLQARKAESVKKSYEQKINDIAWFARPADAKYGGLTGLLFNPNITKSEVSTGATSGVKPFAGKNPTEILKDMNDIVDNQIKLTKGVEIPDTLLLPIAQYTQISSTNMGNGTDTTILEYFLRNKPMITSVEWVNELADVTPNPRTGTSSADLMIAYRKNPEVLTLEIPQGFEQFAAQEVNLEMKIPAHGRVGGVIVYYPLAISIVDGI